MKSIGLKSMQLPEVLQPWRLDPEDVPVSFNCSEAVGLFRHGISNLLKLGKMLKLAF